MDTTPNLELPYLMAAQAQKHVTHNEAIRGLDALVQLMVLDKDQASPPGSPAEGARYIVAAGAAGAWTGQAGKVAAWQDGAWAFYAPREGWLAWAADEDRLYYHTGSAWAEFTGASTPPDASISAPKLALTPPPLGFDMPVNLGLAASVASNALTLAVKGADGNDPSAGNPVLVPFRSATPAAGTPVWRSITAALSLTVSAGSTLGTANGAPFRLWVVLFDDAGMLRLGVANCFTGSGILPLGEAAPASSLAEGGAGGADSAGVIYTGAAVSAKAYRILGFLQWSSGLATAGTWSAGPDLVQLFGPGIRKPGEIVQVQYSETGAVATGTATIPHDDTIPQSTEGNEYMSLAITPTSPANLLLVESYAALITNSVVGRMAGAIFQDSNADALAAAQVRIETANTNWPLYVSKLVRAGTTSSTTFKTRYGNSAAGTTTFNGVSGGRIYGGTAASFMRITELMG